MYIYKSKTQKQNEVKKLNNNKIHVGLTYIKNTFHLRPYTGNTQGLVKI